MKRGEVGMEWDETQNEQIRMLNNDEIKYAGNVSELRVSWKEKAEGLKRAIYG